MSLLKPSLLLSLGVAHWISALPPNPPASPNQLVAADKTDRMMYTSVLWRMWPRYTTYAVLLACIAETVAIAATCYPDCFSITPQFAKAHLGEITPTFLLGWALALLGGYGRFACYRALSTMFTFELSRKPSDTLVTTGPYALVRHPSYTAYMLNVVGVALCLLAPASGPWLVASGAVESIAVKLAVAGWFVGMAVLFRMFFKRTIVEDKVLSGLYGKQWVEWAERVRFRLVPGLY